MEYDGFMRGGGLSDFEKAVNGRLEEVGLSVYQVREMTLDEINGFFKKRNGGVRSVSGFPGLRSHQDIEKSLDRILGSR